MDIKEKVLLDEHLFLLDQKTLKAKHIIKYSLYISIISLVIVGIYFLIYFK